MMLDLSYSIVIEATEDPQFFGFHSPDLPGFSGIGHSIEDCLYKARHGLVEHVQVMKERGLAVPAENPNPTVTIQNEQRRKIA
jgi:predicted RNase H-like HicB family nuclease